MTITICPLVGAPVVAGSTSGQDDPRKAGLLALRANRLGTERPPPVIGNERDMPWRLAVDDIARGASKLSVTIRSFSSFEQRRRRPVSTTSSRSS
jgi:hypothetical protein